CTGTAGGTGVSPMSATHPAGAESQLTYHHVYEVPLRVAFCEDPTIVPSLLHRTIAITVPAGDERTFKVPFASTLSPELKANATLFSARTSALAATSVRIHLRQPSRVI